MAIPTLTASTKASAFVAPGLAQDLLHSTMVVYGPTGSRKTSQIGEFAKYIYETTGKVTRLISVDGGGYGTIQPLVNAGIIVPWRLVEEENIKAAIIKASRGAFPKELKNGLRSSSMIVEPNQAGRKAALKDVGAYAVEGWTSICKAVIRDSVKKGQKISEDVVGQFGESLDGDPIDQEEVRKRKANGTDMEGMELFGAPARAHYGFVQNFIQDVIRNFSALPVDRVLYTALEGKGEDKFTKESMYGPDTAGSALTASIPAFVGDCLHFEDYKKEAGEDPSNKGQKLIEMGVRAWFQSHPDSNPLVKAMWPAKSRVPSDLVEEFRKTIGPLGYFDLKSKSLGDYLRIQDELAKKSTDRLKEWKAAIDAKRAAPSVSGV